MGCCNEPPQGGENKEKDMRRKGFWVGMLIIVLVSGMAVVGCGGEPELRSSLSIVNNSSSTYAASTTISKHTGELVGFLIIPPGESRSTEDGWEDGAFTLYYHQYNGTIKTNPHDNSKKIIYVPEKERRTVNLF